MTQPGIRSAVLAALQLAPQSGAEIGARLGMTSRRDRKRLADALCGLHLSERVERIGAKSGARWRAQTPEEAADAERRRERGRGEGW